MKKLTIVLLSGFCLYLCADEANEEEEERQDESPQQIETQYTLEVRLPAYTQYYFVEYPEARPPYVSPYRQAKYNGYYYYPFKGPYGH